MCYQVVIKIYFLAVDLDGIYTILNWLSYMPDKIGGQLPVVMPSDPIERPISYMPTKSPYDPRDMLAGRLNPTNPGEWESGFFDKDSWHEIMEPWAKTVVTGRGKDIFLFITNKVNEYSRPCPRAIY